MLRGARVLSEWFGIIAEAMKDGKEVSPSEVRDYFVQMNEPLDGESYDPSNERQRIKLDKFLEYIFSSFQQWGLIERLPDRDQFTESLRLHVPEAVGRLSGRGRWLAWTHPSLWTAAFFVLLAFTRVGRWFTPFKVMIGVVGVGLVLYRIEDVFGLIPASIVLVVTAMLAYILSKARSIH